MESSLSSNDKDEVNLRELFGALLSNFWLIALVTLLFASASAYKAFFVSVPLYKSKSVFILPESSTSSLAGLSGAAAFAGIDLPDVDGVNVFDQVNGRDFIVEIADDLNLAEDPHFNGYLRQPSLQARTYRALGLIGPANPPSPPELMSDIVGNYESSVSVGETANGAFTITVTHSDPEKAATLANTVVLKVLSSHRQKQLDEQKNRVQYLRGELDSAREELDFATERVQIFAVTNNILSVQDLTKQSIQLGRLRDQKRDVSNIIAALDELGSLLNDASSQSIEFITLLEGQRWLLQRDVFFRLGEPANDAEWRLISSERIVSTRKVYERQLRRLEDDIATFESQATDTASKAAELAKLEREMAVAGATYEVLVEQFKAQALTSGFALSTGTVFETAVPALRASEPRKSIAVALGFIMGLVFSIGLSLAISFLRGNVYSSSVIESALTSDAVLIKRSGLPRYGSSNVSKVFRRLRSFNSSELSDLSYKLNSVAAPIVVIPGSKRGASGLGLLVTNQVFSAESSTILVDFFGQISGLQAGEERSDFAVHSIESGLDVAVPLSAESVEARAVAKPSYLEKLKDLTKTYDRVVLLVAPLQRADYLAVALNELSPTIVTDVASGQTTLQKLEKLSTLYPAKKHNKGGLLVIC